jgi:drug/metabolite transporter (DMT)-like permease
MNNSLYIILFIFGVVASGFSQVLLKKGAKKNYPGIRMYLNIEVFLGYCIYFCITILAIYLLQYLEIITVVLLEALSYIVIPTLSFIFFKETLNKKQFLGMALIISGIIVYAFFG